MKPTRFFRQNVTLFVGIIWGSIATWAGETITPVEPSSIQAELEGFFETHPLVGIQYSVDVYSLTDRVYIFRRNQDLALNPASNIKIITSAAALSLFGPNFRFQTKIYRDGYIKQGVLHGNLIIKGFGDPSLSPDKVYHIVRQIKLLGIQTVNGDILYDDTYFESEPYISDEFPHPTPSNPPLSALSMNNNVIYFNVVKIGSRSIGILTQPDSSYIRTQNQILISRRRRSRILIQRVKSNRPGEVFRFKGQYSARGGKQFFREVALNPSLYTAMMFKDYLQKNGIRVTGRVRQGVVKDQNLVYTERSDDLSTVLKRINKFSINFTAEMILRLLGATYFEPPGSLEKGLNVIKEFLTSLNITDVPYKIVNGSGLSRENQISASVLVRVLSRMYSDFHTFPEFVSSFGISGTDGTIRKRFKDIKGKIRAKTGYIRQATCLSGYASTEDGKVLAFSLLLNSLNVPHKKRVKIIDQIALVLTKNTDIRFENGWEHDENDNHLDNLKGNGRGDNGLDADPLDTTHDTPTAPSTQSNDDGLIYYDPSLRPANKDRSR